MIYLDIIATDEPESIEIQGTKDHQWVGLKDVLNKPKVSLWQLYRLKKFLETSYERLNKEAEYTEIPTDTRSVGTGVDSDRENIIESSGEPDPKLGGD